MNEFVEYIIYDALPSLDGITAKSLFGGYGLYRHGTIFAITHKDEVYFKVDDVNLPEFKKLGGNFFTYTGKGGKEIRLPYFSVPVETLENPEEAARLANLAYEAGLRSS